MSAIVKGTAHLYGITAGVGPVTNATVLSFSMDDEHANVSQTVNEIGNVIEDRRDDLTKTGSITLRIRSGYTVPAAGSVFTYNSVPYQITKVSRQEESTGFVAITCDIKTSEYVTLS